MSAVETAAPVDAAKAPEVAPETAAPAVETQPTPEVAKEPTAEAVEATPAAAPSDPLAPDATGATEPATTMTAPAEAVPKVEETSPKADEAAPKTEVAAPKVEEEEEPQSELTKKFTEKEWTALKKFRVCCIAFEIVSVLTGCRERRRSSRTCSRRHMQRRRVIRPLPSYCGRSLLTQAARRMPRRQSYS